jgi:hypothetical protein
VVVVVVSAAQALVAIPSRTTRHAIFFIPFASPRSKVLSPYPKVRFISRLYPKDLSTTCRYRNNHQPETCFRYFCDEQIHRQPKPARVVHVRPAQRQMPRPAPFAAYGQSANYSCSRHAGRGQSIPHVVIAVALRGTPSLGYLRQLVNQIVSVTGRGSAEVVGLGWCAPSARKVGLSMEP